LHHFLAMAQEKSMTRAALALNTVQPALSRSLRELEQELGASLFHRTPQGLILTEAGEELLAHTKGPLNQIDAGIASVRGERERASVRISVAPAASRMLCVDAISAFSEQFPAVQIAVEARHYSECVPQIRDGTIDFAVGRILDPKLLVGLGYVHLFEEPIVFCARAGHPLAGVGRVTMAQINGYQIVAPMRYAVIWDDVTRFLVRHGLTEFDRLLETSSYEFSRQYIRETDAITCTSRSIVRPEIDSGEFVQLDIPVDDMMGSVGVTYRAEGRMSPHAQALFDHVRAAAQQRYP
jgi:LysR family pca operon transcriptional activator